MVQILQNINGIAADVLSTLTLNDPEYQSAHAITIRNVQDGALLAKEKWDVYVEKTVSVCKYSSYLHPYEMNVSFESLPLSLPSSFGEYGVLSEESRLNAFADWVTYRSIVRGLEASKPMALEEFWTKHSHRIPSLAKIAYGILSLCPSGAEIERSFKKLRNILPKDHTRDTLNPDTIKMEMFFQYNQSLCSFFNLDGCLEGKEEAEEILVS